MHVYIYTYIYMRIYIHIHIYIQMYMFARICDVWNVLSWKYIYEFSNSKYIIIAAPLRFFNHL